MERLIPISSSFVRNDIKLRSDKGSGEAKLFLGSTSDLSINEFFNNFNENNKYIIYKEELLNYFYKIFIEFIAEKCNNYKNVGLSNYLEKLNELNHLDNKIEFKMEKFSDKKRVYIRPIKSDKWIFDNIIRNIALPKITNLIINKISQNVFHIKIDINVNEVLNRDVSNFESLSELEIISNYLNYQIRYHQKENDLEEFILELKESREQFLSRFSLGIVADKKIEKNELNKILFGKKEDNSLLYNLAENFSIFGSAKQSNTTPVNWNSELFISHLVDIDNYLSNNDVLSSKDNYEELYKYINNLNENYLKRIWFKKYLHILYPTIFPSQHSDENKKEVLRLFSLDIEDSEIDRAWKLLQLEKKSNIPGDYYWRIIWFIKGENDIYSQEIDFKEIKDKFKNWLEIGEYSELTVRNYIYQLVNIGKFIEFNKKYDNNIFKVTNISEYEIIKKYIINHEKFEELNLKSNRGLKSALDRYGEFLSEMNEENVQEEVFETNYMTKLNTKFDRNRILFGAPGTGKSYTLNKEKTDLLKNGGEFERVTFHPDYSYAHFVGTYKPVSNESGEISYEYVPGPFMRTYVAAMKSANSDNPKPYLLIIEEINRANVAGVFGDVFQLLDRNSENISEYPIQTSEDMRKYLAKELGGASALYTEIKIPDNMFIWATMNSADQGVYPMDTAFKRRWNFTYLGINDNEEGILGKEISLGSGDYERKVEWNELRKAINIELLEECKVNEDKLLGPYFVAKNCLDINEKFIEVFKNKIIMYLFDDAAKHKRSVIFSGSETNNIYSEICKEFDEKGIFIFSERVQEKFPYQDRVINEIENSSYNTNISFGNKKVAETKFNEED
jgi:type II restriction-modification system restriction subunit